MLDTTGFTEDTTIHYVGVRPCRSRAEIVAIDTSLADWQSLRDGALFGTEVVLIDGHDDGLAQLAQALDGRRGIEAIHVLSHGFAGGFVLGAATLDAGTLAQQGPALTTIRASLAPEAAILLYGCRIASGDGPAFLSALACITGAAIAASHDLTGAALQGGNWDLQYRSGRIVSGAALSGAAMASYQHTLSPLSTPPSVALTVTNDKAFVRGAGAAGFDLFTEVTAATNDLGQVFTGAVFQAYDLTGESEFLTLAGHDVSLNTTNSGSFDEYAYSVVVTPVTVMDNGVSVSRNLATVTLSGMSLANGPMATLLDGVAYKNTSSNAASLGVTEARPVVLRSVTDNGTVGSNVTAVDKVSTVTIADGPTANYVGTTAPVLASTTITAGTPQTVSFTITLPQSVILIGSTIDLQPVLPAGWTWNNEVVGAITGILPASSFTYSFDITSTGTDTTGSFPISIKSVNTGLDLQSTIKASSMMLTVAPPPPAFVSMAAYIGQNTIVLTYDGALDPANPPPLTAFIVADGIPPFPTQVVSINGTDVSVSNVSVSGSTVTLTVGATLTAGDIIAVNYVDPSVGNDVSAIQGTAGDDAASIVFPPYIVTGGPPTTPPSLTATGGTPTIPAHSVAGVDLFSGVTAATNDTGQTFIGAVITVSGITGAGEVLTIGGFDVSLVDGVSTGLPGLGVLIPLPSVSVAVTSGVATVTLSQIIRDDSQMATLIDGLTYRDTNTNTLAGTRTITVTSVTDSGADTTKPVGVSATVTLPDSTPPATPVISSSALTNDATPVISGTAETGAMVTVTVAGATYTTVATGGAWSLDLGTATVVSGSLVINLNGSNPVSVTATDTASNVSAAAIQSLVIDTIAPPAPVITSSPLSSDTTPVISGTAEAGVTVTVTVPGATYSVVATGGVWSLDLGTATPITGSPTLALNGANAVSAAAPDPAGNGSSPASQTLVIDTTLPPSPVIISRALTNDVTPVISGTAEADDTVTMIVGGAVYTTVATGGAWSFDLGTAVPISGSPIINPNGLNFVQAFATDPAGNVSLPPSATQLLFIDTTVPAAPLITSGALTNDATPVISGTAESGATVAVMVGGATYTTIATGGVWSLDLGTASPDSGALSLNPNGSNGIVATATDLAGNVSTDAEQALVIDTTAPATPADPTLFLLTDSGAAGDGITNHTQPTVGGTGEPGSTISLTGTLNSIPFGLGTTLVDVNGNWSFTPLGPVPSGTYEVIITATDPAGNVSSPSGTLTLIIDTTAPNAPAVTSPALSKLAAPVISGTAEAGTTVTVVVGGATYSAVATVGVWSLDLGTATPISGALALDDNGPNSVVAAATDLAGNVSVAGEQTLTIDTTAPVAPVVTSAALTDVAVPVLSGSAETGSTVTVSAGGATYSVIAAGGAWSIDLATATPLAGSLSLDANGTNSVSATATDPAGNVSSVGSQTLTIDTTAPVAPVVTSPALTDDATPVISGTAEAGATVTVLVGSALYTTIATGGVWSIDLGTAKPITGTLVLDPNGSNSVVAGATDPAGNASSPAGQTLVIDTTVPDAPVITSGDLTDDATPVISGTAESGATVVVTVGGATYTTIATGSVWSIDLATAVADSGELGLDDNGSNNVIATSRDPAGNVSAAAEQTLVIDTTLPAAPVISSNALTDDATPVISGTAESGTTIRVVIAGATYVTVATGGAWSIDLGTAVPVTGLLELNLNGSNSVVTSATDPSGNISTSGLQTLVIDTTRPASPVITSSPLTGDTTPVISGTAEAGATVTLTAGGATYRTIATGGVWSIDLGTAEPVDGSLALDRNGPNVVSAFTTDPAGNVSLVPPAHQTLVIDTTAPDAPVINPNPPTGDATPVISGTAESGVMVTMTVGGATYTTIAAAGVWSIDLGTAVAVAGALALDDNGLNTIVATNTDGAGNVSAPTTRTLSIDIIAPDAPDITSDMLTGDPTPVISGTAESGATVAVTVAGATYTTVATTGVWRLDLGIAVPVAGALALDANGPNSITATATDRTGNVSATAAQTLTVDTTAPNVTASATANPLDNNPDGIAYAPIVTGTGDPDALVTITEGDVVVGTARADGLGAWSFDPSKLVPGAHVLIASETDAAGNTGSTAATPINLPDPNFSLTNMTAATSGLVFGIDYVGPVSYLVKEYGYLGSSNVVIGARTANVFIHSGNGDDALAAFAGSNVLEGGAGSNWLVGADGADGGTDTFFLDARGGQATWDTLLNFHTGDMLTLWGFNAASGSINWVNNLGAAGYHGATLEANLGNGSNTQALVTFEGLTTTNATFTTSTGTTGGVDYLAITRTA